MRPYKSIRLDPTTLLAREFIKRFDNQPSKTPITDRLFGRRS
jgi:hypothetical protein